MGWRYRRRLSILPGLRLNLSGSGVFSASIGHRRPRVAHGRMYAVASRSIRLSAGSTGPD